MPEQKKECWNKPKIFLNKYQKYWLKHENIDKPHEFIRRFVTSYRNMDPHNWAIGDKFLYFN